MDLKEIRKENELVDLFCNLAEIPSPSLKEKNVSDYILKFCSENNIDAKYDSYENVYINIPATDPSKQSILLSSHMDVIGDDSPVKTYVDEENQIHAEGRTLGADDKAGVANALYFAKYLANTPDIKHGGLEIVFTRDEESGMSGIHNLDFSLIHSKYALVLDSDSLGQFMTSGASYTLATISVHSFKGGHSGIDIGDKTRENAAKLIADLLSDLPQGVFHADENGDVITSCNLGGIEAGKLSVTNIINIDAKATYSIRSSSREYEEELKNLMKYQVEDFNQRYKDTAKAEIIFEQHLPPFEKSWDNYIPQMFEAAANAYGVKAETGSFHAGAETHIYANHLNGNGDKFVPFLVGLADVHNMHSAEENVSYPSMIKGQEILRKFFEDFNK